MSSFWHEVGIETRSRFIKDIPIALIVFVGISAGLSTALSTIVQFGLSLNEAYLVMLCGYFGTIGVLVAHACWWAMAVPQTSSSRFVSCALWTVSGYLVCVVLLVLCPKTPVLMFGFCALYICACAVPHFVVERRANVDWKRWIPLAVVTAVLPVTCLFFVATNTHFATDTSDSLVALDSAYTKTNRHYSLLTTQWTSLTEDSQRKQLTNSGAASDFAVFKIANSDVIVEDDFPVLRSFTAASLVFYHYSLELRAIGLFVLFLSSIALVIAIYFCYKAGLQSTSAVVVDEAEIQRREERRKHGVSAMAHLEMSLAIVVILAVPTIQRPSVLKVEVPAPAAISSESGIGVSRLTSPISVAAIRIPSSRTGSDDRISQLETELRELKDTLVNLGYDFGELAANTAEVVDSIPTLAEVSAKLKRGRYSDLNMILANRWRKSNE